MGGIGGSLTGRPVAEKLGVPFVEAQLQPLGPPTAAFPGPLLPQVPRWLGGAGTTGATFRAGVPAVVVPFAVDQPFWGSRVAALGTGPNPIPRKRLTAENLSEALRVATTDAAMARQAAAIGTRIRAEDGVAAAADALEWISLERT